ncbi:MAG: chemotaxis family two-component system response regulator Rcp1 [Verrucomicrobiales bacterium]|jgi:chemotaxis family two-component system response regulator Rcp1
MIDILMVEDNPGDVGLTKAALEDGKIANLLHVCMNGEDALSFLKREGDYVDAPRPDIILLDLNLPGMHGAELLEEIKQDPILTRIPVVVLTTSTADEDILKAYQLHASCYITKPVDFEQFIKVVHSFEDFWFAVVKLPPKDD